MNTQTTQQCDRSGWTTGPWDHEPDRVEWNYNGTPCLAIRGYMGAWCGYAGVRPGHALYGAPHGAIGNVIEVHGGLSYSDACRGHVCHAAIEDDVWWFGFDCGHAFDLAPGMQSFLHRLDLQYTPFGVYRDLEFVQAETQLLADQLNDLR